MIYICHWCHSTFQTCQWLVWEQKIIDWHCLKPWGQLSMIWFRGCALHEESRSSVWVDWGQSRFQWGGGWYNPRFFLSKTSLIGRFHPQLHHNYSSMPLDMFFLIINHSTFPDTHRRWRSITSSSSHHYSTTISNNILGSSCSSIAMEFSHCGRMFEVCIFS